MIPLVWKDRLRLMAVVGQGSSSSVFSVCSQAALRRGREGKGTEEDKSLVMENRTWGICLSNVMRAKDGKCFGVSFRFIGT